MLPLGASARGVGSATITVNSTADTMAVDGQCTLREAIDNANANKQKNPDCAAGKGDDRIVFSTGGTIVLGDELPAVQDNLTIDGGGNSLTIDGNHSFRMFTVTAKNATLMNMKLTNGAGGDGGAIRSLGKTLRLAGLELSFNQASDVGGAVYSESSTLDVRNSNFHDNEAGGGGAIFSLGSLTIQDSVLAENGAEEGGAIFAFTLRMERSGVIDNGAGLVGGIAVAFDASITDSTVEANLGSYPAVLVGALFVAPIKGLRPVTPKFLPHPPVPGFGKATFVRDYITGNESSCFGGGIGVAFVQLTILESTISDNTVNDDFCDGGFGGGVGAEFTIGTIANSTIVGNSAATDGGGIAVGEAFPLNVINSTVVGNEVFGGAGTGGIVLEGGQVNLTNSIVSGNDGGGDDSDCGLLLLDPSTDFVSGGSNIDGDGTCNLDLPTDLPATDPQLLPLGDFGGPTPTMPPADGSLAVDVGNTQACKANPVSRHDQRGVSRPQGKQCDIGAVERTGDESP